MTDIKIIHSECLAYLRTIPDNTFDSIVTDPPYGLKFMAKKWDYDVPSTQIWAECLRVLKPGGYLLAFAGTRTQHRMAVRIEDAGFEIRDMIAWVYGSGFPKSVNVGKELPEYEGYGTGLKPAMEPITVARKPLDGTIVANLLKHGVGAINIDGCRIATDEKLNGGAGGLLSHQRDDKDYPDADNGYNPNTLGRWPANLIHDGSDEVMAQFPTTASGKANIKRQSGTEFFGNSGAAYGDESRPAGTEMISYGDKGSAARFFYCAKASPSDRNEGCDDLPAKSAGDMTGGRKEGSAGLNNPRAGAGRTSGGKNFWPTVKPTELMRYLVKLVTPQGGRLLDPFCGSGSTGKACAIDGVDCTLIDMDEEAVMITEARVSHAAGRPIKRDPTIKPPHWDDDIDGEWVPRASDTPVCQYCGGTNPLCSNCPPKDWDEDLDGPWPTPPSDEL